MQGVKALIKARHSFQRVWFLSHQRSFSAWPNYAPYDDFQDQVLVEGRAKSRAAILNRPSVSMHLPPQCSVEEIVRFMGREPRYWICLNEVITFYHIVKLQYPTYTLKHGSGRAFCSGVDAVTLYHLVNEGKVEECESFFETLYKFVYLQGTYLKPHVAILNGITMGCGGGISLPGMFRLVTDKTVFANPETQLGFHPGTGASFYLSCLPGYLGECLALTGEKLNGVEMIACGLATHYCLNARLAWIGERLGNLMNDDPTVIESSLAQHGDLVYRDRSSILHRIDAIDKCFSHDTVEEIIDSLEHEGAHAFDGWCKTVLGKMKEASPLSLKVTLRSIREGRFQSLDQFLAPEYQMSLAGISRRVFNDFSEGLWAQLVDKDFAPKWNPPSLEEVSEDMVEYYFSPLGELEPELMLPTTLREPYI